MLVARASRSRWKRRPLHIARPARWRANDASRDVRLAIAQAPITGPLAIAVKLAAWADWNAMPETIDPGGLGSVYAWAVAAGGFDPIAAITKARQCLVSRAGGVHDVRSLRSSALRLALCDRWRHDTL